MKIKPNKRVQILERNKSLQDKGRAFNSDDVFFLSNQPTCRKSTTIVFQRLLISYSRKKKWTTRQSIFLEILSFIQLFFSKQLALNRYSYKISHKQFIKRAQILFHIREGKDHNNGEQEKKPLLFSNGPSIIYVPIHSRTVFADGFGSFRPSRGSKAVLSRKVVQWQRDFECGYMQG